MNTVSGSNYALFYDRTPNNTKINWESSSKCSDNDKETRTITTCLNNPLQEIIELWLANLKTVGSGKHAAGIKAGLDAIRKQMKFDDCGKSVAVCVLLIVSTKFIVPGGVKKINISVIYGRG